jgi:HSP20 family molecular chaperone IbpA
MTLIKNLFPVRSQQSTCDTTDAPCASTVTPRYDIKESSDAFGLDVWLPGVGKEGLELTLHEGEIKILGRRSWKQPAGWTQLYRETPLADFALTLAHDSTLDADKVHAELRDGVLRVTLPKAESIKPRKISVA